MGAILALRSGTDIAPTHWDTATDAMLLEASARRVEAAFVVLVERYQRDVYRVVWRISSGHADSEDIAQETFLKLWRNPQQIREAKALKGWLLRVASNLVMDHFRRRPMQDLGAADHVADSKLGPEASTGLAQVSKAIDSALAALPERQRAALVLVHFEQMSNIAAADAMDLSVDALESLLARARRRLRDLIGPQGRDMLEAMESE